jgi:hypothetical protein
VQFFCTSEDARRRSSQIRTILVATASLYLNFHHQKHHTFHQQQPKATAMQATTNTTGSHVSTPPPTPFPLMRLPGELRNAIYREYFNSVSSQDLENRNDRLHALQPSLEILHTNRQLRSEAGSIFYDEYVGDPGGMRSFSIPGLIFYNGRSQETPKKPSSNA